MSFYFLFNIVLQDHVYFAQNGFDLLDDDVIGIRYRNDYGTHHIVIRFENKRLVYESFLYVKCGRISGFTCNKPWCNTNSSGFDLNSSCKYEISTGSETYILNEDGYIFTNAPSFYGCGKWNIFNLWNHISNNIINVGFYKKILLKYMKERINSAYPLEINKIILEYMQ